MNLSTLIPSAQLLFSWALLGLLFGWMLFFAYLAIRPQQTKERENELASAESWRETPVLQHYVAREVVVCEAASAEVLIASGDILGDLSSPVA